MSAPLVYLPRVDSTNTWARDHMNELAPFGAVYTTCQTAGRGRLGRAWQGVEDGGQLCVTVAFAPPLADPSGLPLLTGLVLAARLEALYGVTCQVKWPNDILINGKKLSGTLCEGVPGGWLSGTGVNLCQTQSYFDRMNLPHAVSLRTAGAAVDEQTDPARLARDILENGFAPLREEFAARGIAPFMEEYRTRCINLGRQVWFEGGTGIARDIDDEGRLVVDTPDGRRLVFTGDVSVKGIYGRV